MTRHAAAVTLVLLLGGCATVQHSSQAPIGESPLSVRQLQSRTFELADARLVLKAALDTLQDEGFVIREANAELGLITAVKEWQSSRPNQGLKVLKWIAALPTYGASLLVPCGKTEFTTVEASVNVTQEAARTRVRIGLVAKVRDKEGNVQRTTPVDDTLAYQRLLARMDKALYLQKEGL